MGVCESRSSKSSLPCADLRRSYASATSSASRSSEAQLGRLRGRPSAIERQLAGICRLHRAAPCRRRCILVEAARRRPILRGADALHAGECRRISQVVDASSSPAASCGNSSSRIALASANVSCRSRTCASQAVDCDRRRGCAMRPSSAVRREGHRVSYHSRQAATTSSAVCRRATALKAVVVPLRPSSRESAALSRDRPKAAARSSVSRRARRAGRAARRRSLRTAARRRRFGRARRTSGSRPASAAWCAEQRRAEGVDRADAGRVDLAQQLAASASCSSAVSAIWQPLVALLADAASHFAGGRVGERDRDELAELGGLVTQSSLRDRDARGTAREHERLAAAGAGGERDRDIARVVSCGAVRLGE